MLSKESLNLNLDRSSLTPPDVTLYTLKDRLPLGDTFFRYHPQVTGRIVCNLLSYFTLSLYDMF